MPDTDTEPGRAEQNSPGLELLTNFYHLRGVDISVTATHAAKAQNKNARAELVRSGVGATLLVDVLGDFSIDWL